MNSEDIKKALATCAGDFCDNCQYYMFHTCYDKLKLDARDLIIKQEKEIKQLKTECTLLDDELRNARQETINVLNELKAKSYVNDYCREVVEVEKIDELIAEVLNAEDKSRT